MLKDDLERCIVYQLNNILSKTLKIFNGKTQNWSITRKRLTPQNAPFLLTSSWPSSWGFTLDSFSFASLAHDVTCNPASLLIAARVWSRSLTKRACKQATRLPFLPLQPLIVCLFLSFTAFNSLAGAAMTLGMIASDVVCEKNHKICYLDSATAILIAIALFSYGVL